MATIGALTDIGLKCHKIVTVATSQNLTKKLKKAGSNRGRGGRPAHLLVNKVPIPVSGHDIKVNNKLKQ